jgi:hypothetical protein
MVKRTPVGTWWNQLSQEKRRKVILTINENASFYISDNNILFRWARLDRLTQSQIETYREVDSELKYVERHQGIKQVTNKHW